MKNVGHIPCDLDMVKKCIACLPFADADAGLRETEIVMRLMLGEIESMRTLKDACLESGRRRAEFSSDPTNGIAASTAAYIFEPVESVLIAQAELDGSIADQKDGKE